MKIVILEYGSAVLAIVLGSILFALLGSIFFGTGGMLSGLVQQVLEGGV